MTDENIDEESLRQLQVMTAKLPREIEPPAGAWTAIKSEIDRSQSPLSGVHPIRGSSLLWQRPAFLAAAVLFLVAGSSAITAISLSRRNATVPSGDTAAVASASEVSKSAVAAGTPATLAEFASRENDYIVTVNKLSEILESGRTQLAPETILKLKESLRLIDEAIIEAREALARDPANKALIEMLSTSYDQKVDLLKRSTEMGRT